MSDPIRRRLEGAAELDAALEAGTPVRLILAGDDPTPSERGLLDRAKSLGIPIVPSTESVLWRLGTQTDRASVLGLVGPPPDASRTDVLAAGGVAWGLAGLQYPGNTGFAIRLAEVSGADGVFVESELLHEGRREAVRAAMRADRFLPVFWEALATTIPAARAAGRRVLAIEDVGDAAPWEVDLTGPLLLLVGGERHGIAPELVAACDGALRIPMHGFIPSYNVQAAMAMVAGERLRQLDE